MALHTPRLRPLLCPAQRPHRRVRSFCSADSRPSDDHKLRTDAKSDQPHGKGRTAAPARGLRRSCSDARDRNDANGRAVDGSSTLATLQRSLSLEVKGRRQESSEPLPRSSSLNSPPRHDFGRDKGALMARIVSGQALSSLDAEEAAAEQDSGCSAANPAAGRSTASTAPDAKDSWRQEALDCLGCDSIAPGQQGVCEAVGQQQLMQFAAMAGEPSARQWLLQRGVPPGIGPHASCLYGAADPPSSEPTSAAQAGHAGATAAAALGPQTDGQGDGCPALPGPEWELMLDEQFEGGRVLHRAWRQPLRKGLHMYRASLVLRDATPGQLRAFQLDDAHRCQWDDNTAALHALPAGKVAGQPESAFLYSKCRFPMPMAARDYVYARRVWHRPADGGCYCVSRSCSHPSAPAGSGGRAVRVEDFSSAYVIRTAPGGGAEMLSIYFEDSHVRPGLVNMGIRKGLSQMACKTQSALARYIVARPGLCLQPAAASAQPAAVAKPAARSWAQSALLLGQALQACVAQAALNTVASAQQLWQAAAVAWTAALSGKPASGPGYSLLRSFHMLWAPQRLLTSKSASSLDALDVTAAAFASSSSSGAGGHVPGVQELTLWLMRSIDIVQQLEWCACRLCWALGLAHAQAAADAKQLRQLVSKAGPRSFPLASWQTAPRRSGSVGSSASSSAGGSRRLKRRSSGSGSGSSTSASASSAGGKAPPARSLRRVAGKLLKQAGVACMQLLLQSRLAQQKQKAKDKAVVPPQPARVERLVRNPSPLDDAW